MMSEMENMEKIDAALRMLGSATPDPGMAGRILTRVAAARTGEDRTTEQRMHRLGLRHVLGPVAGFASVGVMCGVIVVASVNHSYRHTPGMIAAPVLPMQGGGVGAASAVRPAAPGSTAPADSAARSSQRGNHTTAQHGRARIGADAKKAPGVAVPAPGSPQQ